MGGGRYCPEDYARAFFCAEAVRRGQNSDVEKFLRSVQKEFPSIQFGDVHVSLDLNPNHGVKFLMADAGDALFIAFQATRKPEDSKSFATLPSGGSVDRGIFELSKSFQGPDFTILSELLRMSEKRVVFCGHGVGGAVAHMVVLHYWAAYHKSGDKIRGDENDMISIAFGAPYICSLELAEEVNGNEELKSHFFSFVHEDDPAISILNGREDHNDGDSEYEADRWGYFEGSAGFWSEVDQLRKAIVQVIRRVFGPPTSKNHQQQIKFFLIGENTHLKASQWSVSRYVPQMPIKLWSGSSYVPQVPIKQWSFYDSYKSALLEGKAPVTGNSPSDAGLNLALNVTTPAPKITSAKVKAMDSGGFIHIKGSNLLFLREPVRLGGLDPWVTKLQTDTELYIVSPTQTDVNIKGDDTENALTFIVLKTAFGAASHLLLEDNMADGPSAAVHRMLSKIVQTFVALATPPLCYLYPSQVLADLDSIAQCVPNLEGEKPSTILKNIVDGNDKENLQENIKKMNKVVQQVVEFLTRSFNIRYKEKLPVVLVRVLGSVVLLAGLMLLPVSGIPYAVSSVASLFATRFVATGAAAMAVAIFLNGKEIMIPEYLAMLKLAIQEAHLWHDGKRDSSLPEQMEAASEALLLSEVEPNWAYLDEMMEKIHNSDTDSIKLSSAIFEGATSDSMTNFLRRMQIVAKTVHMYNTHVEDIKFVGVVGAEDAGKSTFIKKVIERLGQKRGAEVPNIGNDVHTETVRPYQLNSSEKLWLVDFPGINGSEAYADAWMQFTSLPSSCILFLDFKHDIKKDQVKMYKKVEEDFGSKITVVFNRVDTGFKLQETLTVKEQRFIDLRRKAVEKLGCDSKDVHFVCLDPDPVEKLTNLKKVGVLGFEELVEIVLSR